MSVAVVLVDDQPALRQLYRLALEAGGDFRVVGEAGDGAEGVAVARERQPDLVLLDLSMPDRDGLESLTEMRSAAPGAHVVVLSGFRRDRLEPVARELGASGYVEKGVAPTELARLLEAVVAAPPPPVPHLTPDRRAALLQRVQDLV